MEDELIKNFTYRGFTYPIYLDDYGQCFYTIMDGETISFGSFNTEYEDALRHLIDKKLDTIETYDHGSHLSWFFNGYGDRDIGLYCRSRLIKIWLVNDDRLVSINSIKEEAKEALRKYWSAMGIE